MRKKVIFALMAAACFLLAGCQEKEPETPLQEYDGTIEDVADLSSNYMSVQPTATPTPTMTPTPSPTPAPTATPTPSPTPAPETEEIPEATPTPTPEPQPILEKHTSDYDFSLNKLLDLVFQETGGKKGSGYSLIKAQDYVNTSRSITAKNVDGTKEFSLFSDPSSGNTYKRLDIKFSGEDSTELMKNTLLSMDFGFDERLYALFVNGKFNGKDNAPYIGYFDAGYSEDGGTVTVYLEKNSFDYSDKTPGWEDGLGCTVSSQIGSDRKSGLISPEEFTNLLSGIDFGRITAEEKDHIYVMTKGEDKKEEEIEEYSAVFTSTDGGSYEININTMEQGGMEIIFTRPDITTSGEIIQICNYIYQEYFSETLDANADLDKEPLSNDHCTVTKTDSGFTMYIHR